MKKEKIVSILCTSTITLSMITPYIVNAQSVNNTKLQIQSIGIMYTTADSLNVRSGPGTNYETLGKLKKGTAVEVLSESNGWAKINYNGVDGYVSMSYLTDKLPTQQPLPIPTSTPTYVDSPQHYGITDINQDKYQNTIELTKEISTSLSKLSISKKSSFDIEYEAYYNESWKVAKNGDIVGDGNTGIEGIKVNITNAPNNYHVFYRAKVQNQGWQAWVKDGTIAGEIGNGTVIENIEVKVIVSDNADEMVKPVIAVDIGHNVPRPVLYGAINGIYDEDYLTKVIGEKIIYKLRSMGYNVVDTLPKGRYTQKDELVQRANVANLNNVDKFVSIHFNSGPEGANGTEVYYSTKPGSSDMAKEVVNNIATSFEFRNRGAKDGSHLYVLKNTNMSAILVEGCFLDNTDMNKFIAKGDSAYDIMASDVVDAITDGTMEESSYTPTQQDVFRKFKEFYTYELVDNSIIDLRENDALITSSLDATNILKKEENGIKYDRQKYLDAWNKLSDAEKETEDMQNIKKEYTKIVSITEATQATLKFYEDIKNDGSNIIKDNDRSIKLNDKSNMSLGARGKAYKEYNEATKHGENSKNSSRMNYINQKYLDTVNFLEAAEFLGNSNIEAAKTEASKIVDDTLRTIAENEMRSSQYTPAQKEVIQKFEQFYIYGPMDNPTIDLSNKENIITKSSDATNILKKVVDGKKYDRQKYLDAWNKLSDAEKENEDMQTIKKEYTKIVSITEAAQATLRLYEDVKKDANSIMQDKERAIKLNDKSNMSLGARGKAYKEYNEATKHGENSKNSSRMNYINQKYLDTVNFLEAAEFLGNNNIEAARTEANKIQDSDLKNIAINTINIK